MTKQSDYEAIVVGGGPAGLAAASWLGRYLHRTALIDAGDPRNWATTGVNGYLGLPNVRPALLRKRGRTECVRYNVQLIDGRAVSVLRMHDGQLAICLSDESVLTCDRLVLAMGVKDEWPELPGLDRCYGQDAHHCPDCDGHLARNRRTVVIGHDRKAAALAFLLLTWTRDIIICTNGIPCSMDAALIEKLTAQEIPIMGNRVVLAHSEERRLKWLELDNGAQLDCEKLFFTVTHIPADDLGDQLGCDRDDDGYIIVDHAKRTSVGNVYAIGDITPGPQLAIRAAADGAVCAVALHRSLLPAGRRL